MPIRLIIRLGLAVGVWVLAASYTLAQPRREGTPQFIDPQNMDLTVRPGDDFYRYANGGWLQKNPVPASKTSWGSFEQLREKSLVSIKTLLEQAAATPTRGRMYQLLGDFYTSGLDTARLNALGFDPIKDELARLENVNTKAALLDELAYQRSFGNAVLWNFGVVQDRKNPNKYLPSFSQGGTTLPDRDYYLKDDTRSQKIREAYLNHLIAMLGLIGEEPTQASQDADVILRLETALARAQLSRVAMRDPYKTYNKMPITAFNRLTPGINWHDVLVKLNVTNPDTVLVQSPAFYQSLDSLITATPIENWQTYLRWHILKNAAPYLSNPFVDEHFAFTQVLTGQKQQTPRWQRIGSLVDGTLGDLLGQLYVQAYFKPEAKQRMMKLVDNLEASFKEHIQRLDWMSADTKKRALAKLLAFKRKIGYPEKWKTYEGLSLNRSHFYENVKAVGQWHYTYVINRLGKPVDRTEWGMTPPTINAYYNPVNNEIAFPAGILQFPFFDFDADDAVNYGAIGAAIGHEMTHGFDDSGRQYDADGTLRDWWTKDDAAQFKTRATQLKNQYDAFVVLDTLHVNGQLTLGENLADLGGLSIAYDAFKKTNQGKSRTKLDGFTPDQRFFLSWAQVWRSHMLPELQAQYILTNPHAPGMFRCNGVVANMAAWYNAFSVRPGDAMYKKPEQRIEVW